MTSRGSSAATRVVVTCDAYMTRDVNRFVGFAAPILAVGLVGGCVKKPYNGEPNAPIEIRKGALGNEYLQQGRRLERAQLFRVLNAGSADVRSELQGQGAIRGLGLGVGSVAGALIGYPLGRLTGGDAGQMFLLPIGASLASVVLAIESKADARLHRAVLLHNAHHGVGDVDSIAPLSEPRTSWLLRSVASAGHVVVDESIHSLGPEGRLTMSGPSFGYDWSLGYFVLPGLAVSGNLLGLSQFTNLVRAEAGPDPAGYPGYLHYNAALANVTYYVVPDLGLYAVGGVGYGAEFAETISVAIQPGASGIAFTGGVGWDFTIGKSGAVGVIVRGLYSHLGGTFDRDLGDGQERETNFSDRWSGITVGLSLTYY